ARGPAMARLRSDVVEADRAVAVQPFTAAVAAAALAVLVDAGVVGLVLGLAHLAVDADVVHLHVAVGAVLGELDQGAARGRRGHGVDRKSARLNSSHAKISYAVFSVEAEL